jgi:N-acetylmuramoyl-L-alanine amidase
LQTGGWRRRALLWAALLAAAGCVVAGIMLFAERGQSFSAMPECPGGHPVVIDPGHGGIDGGTNVPGMLEKDVVLDVALRTKQYLDKYQVPALLTRSDDVQLGGAIDRGRLRRDLNYRIAAANHCQASLMLSLHVNSTRNTAERGVMVFYQPSRASRDAAYLFDESLRRWPVHERRERPIPRTNLAVLKTKAPSLLIELGFITNSADRQLLSDPAYREKLAQALSSSTAAIYHKWLKQGSQ